MTKTSHGHHIPGSPTFDERADQPVARCSVFLGCARCIQESSDYALQSLAPAKPSLGIANEAARFHQTTIEKILERIMEDPTVHYLYEQDLLVLEMGDPVVEIREQDFRLNSDTKLRITTEYRIRAKTKAEIAEENKEKTDGK